MRSSKVDTASVSNQLTVLVTCWSKGQCISSLQQTTRYITERVGNWIRVESYGSNLDISETFDDAENKNDEIWAIY